MRQLQVRAMILDKVPQLVNHRIILASASPRRQELLKQIGLKYEVGCVFISWVLANKWLISSFCEVLKIFYRHRHRFCFCLLIIAGYCE